MDMTFAGNFAAFESQVIAALLMSLRIGAMLLMTPILSAANLPAVVRVLFVLALSGALVAGAMPIDAQPLARLAARPGPLVLSACSELALGLTLAAAIHLAFSAFALAGRLLDIQIGFGLGQVFDPASSATAPILSTVFNQAAVLVFFVVDGHYAVLRAVGYSLERFPLGRSWPIEGALLPVIGQMGGVLGLAFALAAPVVFCILLVELALGVLARNLPQMNMLTMGIPIKICVGLIALSLWFSGIGPVMDRAYRSIYQTWDAIFAAEGAGTAPRGQR